MSITPTTLKPWRAIAKPHKDVLEGTFKQSEFAADITQVRNGTATAEYQDAEKFFARTFITEGMRLLLISVAQRLAGMGGDPVIQLQTAFGGGKTHTMLAVYHLANRKVNAEKLPGILPILDAARIPSLPRANVAVIDGINLSGCSSFVRNDQQLGIPTMAPMAKEFLSKTGENSQSSYLTQAERDQLKNGLGIDLTKTEYQKNLECLMEVLFSAQMALKDVTADPLKPLLVSVNCAVEKVKKHVLKSCSEGEFAGSDSTVATLYQKFYQKLIFRDRALPRPWVFNTNYDLFNEVAMDRLGIPYCNGFSGAIERRFNPSVFRYSLAEQLDVSSRKWTAVDNFVYLCKLHGSINWVEDSTTLFPIRELQEKPHKEKSPILIYLS